MKFTEYDCAANGDKAREMIKISGQRGVPVIVVDGLLVIGFNRTRLDELLAG